MLFGSVREDRLAVMEHDHGMGSAIRKGAWQETRLKKSRKWL